MGLCACSVPDFSRSLDITVNLCASVQLVSNRMGALIASLAVTMLVALALSGSDEGSGLAIKSAKLSQAKINGFSPKQMANMEQVNSVLVILLEDFSTGMFLLSIFMFRSLHSTPLAVCCGVFACRCTLRTTS